MKNLVTLTIILTTLIGCGTSKENDSQETVENKEMNSEDETQNTDVSKNELIKLKEKDSEVELSLKEESSFCFVKEVYKQNNEIYVDVDFINTEYKEVWEEGEKIEYTEIVNNNPKLRSYKIDLANENVQNYSEIIEIIQEDKEAVFSIEAVNGEVVFLYNSGLPG